ncbi:carbohydrate ABC transporter permease [Actinospica sp. MGRD01-02]|uniref:Carbohydrate ABC transporter permease n=1 Tax=Actinospica acidithermotolerans TaxID=2828514 RepID=A0A941EBX2_9ACTN|nr:carbohydrate ABC transporter permease [Actinospica acidithermotolerans]MBR7826209.1 carbohydrate ABC transporter permease [Actinospica acidithermotolerans]
MSAFDAQTRTLISRAQLNRPLARRIYWVLLVATIAVFTLVFLFPLYWVFSSGLKSASEVLQSPPTLIPHSVSPHNYATAWSDFNLGRYILNTTYYAVGALLLQLVFDVAAAYALSKLRPVLGNVVLALMLATLMIPATVLVIPNYLTAINVPVLHLNLVNSPMAIWLPAVANGFNIFLLKRFFDSIPEELLAAAAIDGAGPLRALWSIVLPMSRPILGVVSIFGTVAVWKDVLWPLLVLTDPTKMTVNTGLLNLTGDGIPENILMASLAIASVPTIVFFLVFQRSIMSGLTTGSLKG